jgi:hypothetical protein
VPALLLFVRQGKYYGTRMEWGEGHAQVNTLVSREPFFANEEREPVRVLVRQTLRLNH